MDNIKELKEKIRDLSVLFVDDELEIREGTGTFLKKFFDNVTICANGEEGLNSFIQNPTNIIISDVLMPKMDGISMIEEIKKHKSNIFIIVITAFREEIEDKLSEIDMYIKKPLSYEDMLSILNTIAQNYEKDK